MVFDKRLLRWLNCLGATMVLGLVLYIGFISWKAHDSLKRAAPVAGMDEFHESVWAARHATSEKRFSEAEEAYRRALVVRPGSPTTTLELARFYEDRGQDGKAEKQYALLVDGALARKASVVGGAETLVRYGDVCLRLGHKERARRAFAAVLDGDHTTHGLDPTSLASLRAESYFRVGRFDDAVRLEPCLWNAYESGVHRESGAKRSAWLKRFAEALRRFPDDPMGHVAYAETLRSLGLSADAFQHVQGTIGKVSGATREYLKHWLDDFRHRLVVDATLYRWEFTSPSGRLGEGTAFVRPVGQTTVGLPGASGGAGPAAVESRFDGPVARGLPFDGNGVVMNPAGRDASAGPSGPPRG